MEYAVEHARAIINTARINTELICTIASKLDADTKASRVIIEEASHMNTVTELAVFMAMKTVDAIAFTVIDDLYKDPTYKIAMTAVNAANFAYCAASILIGITRAKSSSFRPSCIKKIKNQIEFIKSEERRLLAMSH
jgi:hypothetical protein